MKKMIKKLISLIYEKMQCCYENEKIDRILSKLGKCGKNVTISFGCIFSPLKNCFIGNHVFFGSNGVILTTDSTVHIGNKVIFGPEFMIVTCNHRINAVGRDMFDVKEKDADNLPVVIKDDVWVGARAIILKGVTIEEGAVVAAGSVVTKSVPAYAIVGGVSAKVIGTRFSDEELSEHKRLINRYGDSL